MLLPGVEEFAVLVSGFERDASISDVHDPSLFPVCVCVGLFVCSFVRSFVCVCVSLFVCLLDCLLVWLVGWLVGWLAGGLSG